MNKKKNLVIACISFIIIVLLVSIIVSYNNKKVEKYTIMFDTDGGTKIENIIVNKNETIKRPNDPTKDGYNFLGWYLNDIVYDFNNKINKNYELTAKWVDKSVVLYTVTFNYENENENLDVKVEKNKTIAKPKDPVKKDYTFDGWYVEGNKFDYTSLITKNITIIAHWKKNEVKTTDSNTTKNTNTTIKVSNVSLNKQSVTLNIGSTFTAVATVYPNNATNKSIIWSSSNNSIATVKNGIITAIAKGTVKITAKASNNSTATISVIVEDKLVDLILSLEKNELKKGNATKLNVTKNPSNTSEKYVYDSSTCNELNIVQQAYGFSITYTGPELTNQKTCLITVKSSSGSITKSINLTLLPALLLNSTDSPTVSGNVCVTVTSNVDVSWTLEKNLNSGSVEIAEQTTRKIKICGEANGSVIVHANADGEEKLRRFNFS